MHLHPATWNLLPSAVIPTASALSGSPYVIKSTQSMKKCQLAFESAYVIAFLEFALWINVKRARHQGFIFLSGNVIFAEFV